MRRVWKLSFSLPVGDQRSGAQSLQNMTGKAAWVWLFVFWIGRAAFCPLLWVVEGTGGKCRKYRDMSAIEEERINGWIQPPRVKKQGDTGSSGTSERSNRKHCCVFRYCAPMMYAPRFQYETSFKLCRHTKRKDGCRYRWSGRDRIKL